MQKYVVLHLDEMREKWCEENISVDKYVDIIVVSNSEIRTHRQIDAQLGEFKILCLRIYAIAII